MTKDKEQRGGMRTAEEPPVVSTASPELKAKLAPVLQADSKPQSISDVKLDEMLSLLSNGDPTDTCAEFMEWLSKASAKSRTGLLTLVQRILARALDANVTVAEEL